MGHYLKVGGQFVWHETQPEYASQSHSRPIDVRRSAQAARRPRWTAAGRSIAELRAWLDDTNAALLEHEQRAREREFAKINAGPVITEAEAKRRREWEAKGNGACSALPFMASKYV